MRNICKLLRRLTAAAFLILCACAAARAEVRINEVMAQNGTYVNGHAYDWIELYNDGQKSVDLSGWHLSDKPSRPDKWTFPAGAKMDEIALKTKKSTNMLTPIKVEGGQINLSGIDTQIKNKLSRLSLTKSIINVDQQVRDELIREIFIKISDCLTTLLQQAAKRSGLKDIIMHFSAQHNLAQP